MKLLRFLYVSFALITILACHQTSVPSDYDQSDQLPPIYPDYINVTIPVNIAPLSFMLDETADAVVTRYLVGDEEIVCDNFMQPSLNEWRQLISHAKGADIEVDVYALHEEKWTRYQPFSIHVSSDSIDPYISYRLISPSFVSYEELTINQRCLENYEEHVIYDNMLCGFENEGQCINCHNYQQYNPKRMQFHARQKDGGTIIAYDGTIKKVNMRNDSILSAGVYPAWHPWLKLIVYSTDKTTQSFHTVDRNKIEVYDSESDLIVYDIDRNEVTNLENDTSEYEVFPTWAPDGRTLYFCSARLERKDITINRSSETLLRYQEMKYNLYKKSFDPETRQFGARQLVFNADTMGYSAVLPRISPDGRFLLFTMAQYGYFHIWHHDADLWMLDLVTDSISEAHPMKILNSPDTESYHSWSSNGRWIIFSSRRDDGVFTRPFIAHIDAQGQASRPFELPSQQPDHHRMMMKSYNIPEFMHGPVTMAPQTLADILKGEAVNVKYVSKLTP